jgi:hypothetical protein
LGDPHNDAADVTLSSTTLRLSTVIYEKWQKELLIFNTSNDTYLIATYKLLKIMHLII